MQRWRLLWEHDLGRLPLPGAATGSNSWSDFSDNVGVRVRVESKLLVSVILDAEVRGKVGCDFGHCIVRIVELI